jgi:hypothetical protein
VDIFRTSVGVVEPFFGILVSEILELDTMVSRIRLEVIVAVTILVRALLCFIEDF